MRNLIIGAIFGAVTGAVIGASFIGPELDERIPGFVQHPRSNITSTMPVVQNRLKTLTEPRDPQIKVDRPKFIDKNTQITQWRMASAYGLSIPLLGDLAKRVERQIWRVSDGRFEVKFHSPGTLVDPEQMFDAVRSGTIDAAFTSPAEWADKVRALSLFSSVPFGPTAREYMAWFYFSDGQKIYNEIYHKRGIHSLICGMSASEASGWFKKKIQTTEDLKGLRMRISGLGAKVMQKLGVETQILSDGDVLVAFESGVLDAAEFFQPAVDFQLGIHKMANNYYFPSWHQPATLFELMINLDSWEALSTAQKSQLEAVCGDNVRHSLAQSEAIQFNALKQLVGAGVNLQTWPTEVLDQLRRAWRDVVTEESRTNVDFRRVWKSIELFREEFSIWRELIQP